MMTLMCPQHYFKAYMLQRRPGLVCPLCENEAKIAAQNAEDQLKCNEDMKAPDRELDKITDDATGNGEAVSELEGLLAAAKQEKEYQLQLLEKNAEEIDALRKELEEARACIYPHMCRDEHEEIGHRGDSALCPLCVATGQRDEAVAHSERVNNLNSHLMDNLSETEALFDESREENERLREVHSREIDKLQKELEQRKGCDHLDAPYRELLKKNADLESLLFIANGQIDMAEERREEQNLKWGKEVDELRRQLRNAQDRLTCGTHPGLSCLEVHTSDRDSMARLTRANHYLSDYIEELEEKKRGNK
jgi:DNA repair exonuclease SbcCD ATPase subunit